MLDLPSAQIHLSSIAANWQALDTASGKAEAAACVKADGYGHGLAEVGRALAEAGCTSFFVANMEEGAALRDAVGDAPVIYILHGLTAEDEDIVRANTLTPVLNTLDQVRCWRIAGLSDTSGACLHFDTGMNRLGLRMEQLDDARTMLDGRPVDLIMSHLACAEDARNTMNRTQRGRFLECCGYWPSARRSLSNTGGIYLGEDFHFDLTRPGIGLYGGGVSPLKPGMTLTAPILSIFTVPKASSTGYGATRRFDEERRLATVALGYADGMPRSASNSGFGMIAGARCPIVGRVSMDLTTLDVTHVKAAIAPGMRVEFIGPEAPLEVQAEAASTLGYELVTGLSTRVRRDWQSD